MKPQGLVRRGYDRAASAYERKFLKIAEQQYSEWLDCLTARLDSGARILDLGCGSGIPSTRLLAQNFDVTGVDISPVQIRRASRSISKARFIRADMTKVSFPAMSFDAVISLYSIIHVPIEEQSSLLGAIATWLTPSGLFLATLGDPSWTGVEENWLGVAGVNMYYSCADQLTYRRWLVGLGFDIIEEGSVPENGEASSALFLAQMKRR